MPEWLKALIRDVLEEILRDHLKAHGIERPPPAAT